MRPRRFGPLLLLAACGDPTDTQTTATAGITSVTASSSTSTSTSDPGTSEPTPTTSAGSTTAASETSTDATTRATTDAADTDTDTTGATTGTSEPASGTSATDTSGDTAASDATTTTTGASTTAGETTDETTAEPCPIGQDGCPCGQNDACDPGLECQAGLCGPPAPPVCGDGDVEGGEQCDDGNKIPGDGCENDCTPTPAPATDPCGFPSDGVWLEIDYGNAFTATNPKWTYSPTPGWGEVDWAPQGESWPEVWDVYQNVEVEADQIGTVAIVDGNGALQIMFGIGGLTYDYATVCVQGRSYSVGSSVTFTVQNQLNKCGSTGMMANDWSIHSTGVDLGTCIVDNNEFQGLRIFASGGSGALSLKRLRFTLHGAVY
ncbi:DUF4215 domain-containing protein [Nannocystis punicea]|uniref:DUF4215 domain-containing protein n=1 Tax=Nannocystis punicea TaxID=2995304 RepID=A0ABY7HGM7_9BACT|nr:DUF4215 domain-containing protein [Nannocystis poenicansa]WAS98459.1 DUF4215 domain-containing protein [Nannocystis poenicansa]